MSDGRSPFFAHQVSFPESGQSKGSDQIRGSTGGNCLGKGLAADGGGLEAICTPAYVDEKTLDGREAHDRTEVRRHVAQTGPLPEDADLAE